MDFTSLSTIMMFGECDTRPCVNISIVDDLVLETVEVVTVTLTRPPGMDSRITLGQTQADIEIIDNDSERDLI